MIVTLVNSLEELPQRCIVAHREKEPAELEDARVSKGFALSDDGDLDFIIEHVP
jgi:hypothetical protein